MSEPIRVLIADDQQVVREGLTMVLGFLEDVEVVAAAADGTEAVALAAELRPDVVLMTSAGRAATACRQPDCFTNSYPRSRW